LGRDELSRNRHRPGKVGTGNQGRPDPERDAKRLIRALKKTAYDALRKKKERDENEALTPVTRVYLTMEDHVGIEHLNQWNGVREEFQTSVSKSHEV
jgi:hypothetical protein